MTKLLEYFYLYAVLILSLIAAYFLAPIPYAMGANVYVRQGAAGSGTGADWTNAYTDIPDTEGTSTAVSRGDTIYIADGTYGGQTFSIPASGSTYIYVKKATVADHGTDTGWAVDDSYGDGQATFSNTSLYFGSNYWEFDGQVGYDDGSVEAHGFRIYNSAATSSLKLLRYSAGASRSYINVRHTEIRHAGGSVTYDGYSHDAVYVNTGYQCTNNIFQYCYIHEVGRAPFLLRNWDYGTIEHCVISNCNGNGPPNCPSGSEHSEPVSAVGCDYNIVRHNQWNNYCGTCCLCLNGTNNEVYGNLIYNGYNSNGIVSGWTAEPSTGTKVYNNTFADIAQASRIGVANDSGFVTYNNLFYNCTGIDFKNTHAYNAFSGSSIYNETGTGQSGITSAIFTDYAGDDFTLKDQTVSGTTLDYPYNQDMSGAYRGSDGTWDRGYDEFDSGAVPPSGPWDLTLNIDQAGGQIAYHCSGCGAPGDCTYAEDAASSADCLLAGIADGTVMYLTVTTVSGFSFASLTGAAANQKNTTVTMSADKTVALDIDDYDPPTGFNCVYNSSNGDVECDWTHVATRDHYNLYWDFEGTLPYEEEINVGDVDTFDISGMEDGTYFFYIKAVNATDDTSAYEQMADGSVTVTSGGTTSTTNPSTSTTAESSSTTTSVADQQRVYDVRVDFESNADCTDTEIAKTDNNEDVTVAVDTDGTTHDCHSTTGKKNGSYGYTRTLDTAVTATQDYLNIIFPSAITGDISFGMWFNIEDFDANAAVSEYYRLWALRIGASGATGTCLGGVRSESGGLPRVHTLATTVGYDYGAVTLTDDTWYWLTCSANGSDQVVDCSLYDAYENLLEQLQMTTRDVGNITSLRIGNTNSDVDNTAPYWDDVVIDYTDGTYPLLPPATASGTTTSSIQETTTTSPSTTTTTPGATTSVATTTVDPDTETTTVPAVTAYYYVDPTNGSDSYSGRTKQSAWKTLDAINNNSFYPGAEIGLLGASYTGAITMTSSGTPDYPISLVAYGNSPHPYVDATGENYGLNISADYIVSEGIDYANASVANINIGGDNNIVSDCSVTSGVLNNLTIASGSDNNLVEHITSTGANGHGIGIFSNSTNNTDGNTIRDSLIYGNGLVPPVAGEGQGIMVYTYDATHRIRNLIVEDNTIYSNGADDHDHGIYDEGYNTIIRNNLFYNHYGFGIKIENGRGGSDCKAYNNVILRTSGNNAGGIHLTDTIAGAPFLTNNIVANNTVVNCGNASPSTLIWYYIQNATTDTPSGNYILNNIFYNVTNAGFGLISSAAVGSNTGKGLTIDYNLYYFGKADGGTAFWYSSWGGTASNTLAAHKTNTGQDAHSVSNNPYFVNQDNYNFNLRSYSPARDAGASLRGIKDCVGPCDIGAYEHEPIHFNYR